MTGPPRTAASVVVVSLLVGLGVGATGPAPADAAVDGGASSRVVGRGNIVTSILGWNTGRTRVTGERPRCAWRTLDDAQLEWLVSISSQAVGLGLDTPLLEPLRAHLGGDELPDGDLQGYVCGLETHELRFVERSEPASPNEVLLRRMITRIPVPRPDVSPPGGVAVPIGQPVFVSLDPTQWRQIGGTITFAGVTAEVRAEPIGMRVTTGDPAVPTVTCDGPGRAYRPGGAAVAEQADHPDACTTAYRTASRGLRSARAPSASLSDGERPETWLGTLTVVWSAQWRIGDGAWTDLGTVARTRLIERSARDLTTSVESGRR